MKRNIIDVSSFNGNIDWNEVKGYADGAIIRIGYRGYDEAGTLEEDTAFRNNIAGARINGIPAGVYWFTTAINRSEAEQEAEFVSELLNATGSRIVDFPVYVDSEYSSSTHSGRSDRLSRAERTECIEAFCDRIEKLGYRAGVYASDAWFDENLEIDRLGEYSLWVARYGGKPFYVRDYDGWQYTSQGRIPGIEGYVDKSYFYRDFEGVENYMTEQQLKNLIESTVNEILNKNADKISTYLKDEFEEAVKLGITDGTRPGAFMTREEGAVMAYRARESSVK